MGRIFLALAFGSALLVVPVGPSPAEGLTRSSVAALLAQATPKDQKQAPKASQQKGGPSACGGDRRNRCHPCARYVYDEAGIDGWCQYCRSCGSDCGDKDC